MRVECEINLTLLVRAMIDALKVVVAGASERCAEIDQALERAGLEYQLICEPDSCQDAPLCRWLKPERMNQAGRVRAELEEAIATLERTRHAFRSRQLADLRYRLQGLLRSLSEEPR
ncbi:hypothetical protein SAMN05216256_11919 [Halopseudomonas pachastrellae]|nr:hypothetical protein SAMN05216256_11919 [Halopseudomonas pachastrellae]